MLLFFNLLNNYIEGMNKLCSEKTKIQNQLKQILFCKLFITLDLLYFFRMNM